MTDPTGIKALLEKLNAQTNSYDTVIIRDFEAKQLVAAFEAERQSTAEINRQYLRVVSERDDSADELEELREEISGLKEKHRALRESMAAIHNTIRGSGGHVSLSVLLSASEDAWRASSTVDKKVKEQSCDKCGGKGSYHCPQMLGTVECECGIVKDGE